MKIQAQQLNRHLSGTALPLYWVAGDETLLVQEATDSIRRFLAANEYSEREVWHVDNATDWQALLLSANSLSLFASRKRIELRLGSGKPGDRALKALSEYLKSPNPDCVLLASGPKLDAATGRSKAFKQIEASGLLVPIWPIDSQQLPGWIDSRLRQAGYRASREALALLSERVEGNLLAARQEIDKLLLVSEAGEPIDVDTVMRTVADSARYNVFDLSQPLLLGNARDMLRMLDGLREEGTDATALLWAISRDLRRLAPLRQAMDRGERIEQAMDKLGIWKKQQRSFRTAAERLTLPALQRCLAMARDVDQAIKGASPLDPWQQLRSLGLAICAVPFAATAP